MIGGALEGQSETDDGIQHDGSNRCLYAKHPVDTPLRIYCIHIVDQEE